MKQFLICLSLLVLATSCNDDKKKVEALQKETEAIHDAAMKDLAEMNRIAREIKTFMTTASMTPEQSAVFTNALAAVGTAENDMMSWMRDYKEPSDQPAAEALKYLQEQKKLIEKNHADIKTATEAAKKLLPQ